MNFDYLNILKGEEKELLKKKEELLKQININKIKEISSPLLGYLNDIVNYKPGRRLIGSDKIKLKVGSTITLKKNEKTPEMESVRDELLYGDRKRGTKTSKIGVQVEIAFWFYYNNNDDQLSNVLNLIYMTYDYSKGIGLTNLNKQILKEEEKKIKAVQDTNKALKKLKGEIEEYETMVNGSDTETMVNGSDTETMVNGSDTESMGSSSDTDTDSDSADSDSDKEMPLKF